MSGRSVALQKFVHFMTAFVIAMKGVAKLEEPRASMPLIALFFASAIYIVITTILHDRLHHHLRWIDASVFAIEIVLTGIIAAGYFAEGKPALGGLMALAATLFGVALTVHLLRTRRREGKA